MKHHLNIILLALRVLTIAMAITAVEQFYLAYVSFTDIPAAVGLIGDTFESIVKSIQPSAADVPPLPWFFICNGLLLCYLVYVLANLYRSFNRLKKGDIFYEKQALEFRRAGAGIIIYAKCSYLIHCGFGALFFKDLGSFVTQVPMFLGIYLCGKMVLVLYYMAEKGTFLRQENDLTI